MPGTSAAAELILGHFENVNDRTKRRVVTSIGGSRIDPVVRKRTVIEMTKTAETILSTFGKNNSHLLIAFESSRLAHNVQSSAPFANAKRRTLQDARCSELLGVTFYFFHCE